MSSAPDESKPPSVLAPLDAATAEIDQHLSQAGWDQPPALFALVATTTLADDPETAALLGIDAGTQVPADALTPIAQDPLPDATLDESLSRIEWPDAVAGCALAHEIVVLPPEAEASLAGDASDIELAAAHPQRREARLVVSVLRDGKTSCVLRLRGAAGSATTDSAAGEDPITAADEVVFGDDLAPNLARALHLTFSQ